MLPALASGEHIDFHTNAGAHVATPCKDHVADAGLPQGTVTRRGDDLVPSPSASLAKGSGASPQRDGEGASRLERCPVQP